MYRLVTFYLLENNINLNDESLVCKNLNNINIGFKDGFVLLNDKKYENEIRSDIVTSNVSLISSYKCVREFLVSLQRKIASTNDIILDGRDIGSVVLKDADYKFYLTADVDERARRRFNETIGFSFNEIKRKIIDRDNFDKSREISPLIVPEDAIIIDSTNLNIDETVNKIIGEIKNV